MNGFKILYTDGTQFTGDTFTRDWEKVDDTKQIAQLQYVLGDKYLVMEGFKQYNHFKECLGMQVKGYSAIILMGRREKDTLIITFDLIKKKIYQKMVTHGKEYGVQILDGWREGVLNKPQAYFKKLDNIKKT